MAKQVINIGTVANDGTGDPLRTAFDKVNDNFTELYNDDSGDVDSVNGQTGTVVLDTDDISEGASNLYNATHTGEVTGATALTIANDVISYAKLANEFTEKSTQADLLFNNNAIHEGTLSGDVTLNIIGVKQGETKSAIFTGGTSLAFGGTVGSTYNIIAGTYDPAVENFIQVFASGVSPNQDFYITISQTLV